MRTLVMLTLAGGIAVIAASPLAVAAASSTLPATAAFSDRAGDHIKSDGRGPYVDGTDGVVSHFFTNIGEQDWVQFHTSQKPGRTVVFLPQPDGDSPSVGALLNAEKPTINFDDLGSVVTTRQLDTAGFDTSVGRFRFDSADPATCLVWATRTGDKQWTVSTTSPTGIECAHARLIRTSTVKGQTKETVVGHYTLPFEITVSLK